MRPSSECPVSPKLSSPGKATSCDPLSFLGRYRPWWTTGELRVTAGGGGVSSCRPPPGLGHLATVLYPPGLASSSSCRRSSHQVVPGELCRPGVAVRTLGCIQESLQTKGHPSTCLSMMGALECAAGGDPGGESGE